jgi:hypothetical protein
VGIATALAAVRHTSTTWRSFLCCQAAGTGDLADAGGRQGKGAGVRFRPRLVDAAGRTVRFADHSTLEDVGVVVWATGYRSDYAWIQTPGVVWEGRLSTGAALARCPGCISWACPGSGFGGWIRRLSMRCR